MKHLLLGLICLMTVQSVRAASASGYYYHEPSGEFYSFYNFNHDTQTATYYDYKDGKKKTANISDLSAETKSAINGVKQGDHVLLNQEGHNFCEVFHVFENGVAYIGCQVNKIRKNIGMDRPQDWRYFAPTEILVAEVAEVDGFKKKERVILTKDAGTLVKGTEVRIEAVFANGEILVQKMGFNRLDTSSLRLKFGVVRVHSSDIEKIN